jgi:hypothetical protein
MRHLTNWLIDRIIGYCWSNGRARVIPDRDVPTEPYITRYYFVFRRWTRIGDLFNVFLHRIHRSDAAGELHTHPGGSMSVILTGGYIEHTPHGSFIRRPGDIIFRGRAYAHRLDILPGIGPTFTLFITWGWTGHKWGFLQNGKVIDHKTYLRSRRTA